MKKWMLGILLIIFLAPGVLAYVFYMHPNWIAASKTNRGQLLSPAVFVPDVFVSSQKWHIVFWSPGKCTKKCMATFDGLTRLRIALGRKLYEVDLDLLNDTQAITKTQLGLTNKPEIFIVNPQHYWILRYSVNAPLDDLYNDIKKLL